jgi:hypothetical protein
MRRKGEDTFAMKRRRMPYVPSSSASARDPCRLAHRREIEAMVKRIAAAGGHFSSAGWREEAGFLLFYFPTWTKERVMQYWMDRSGIAHRPMPMPYSRPQRGVGNHAPTATLPPAPRSPE